MILDSLLTLSEKQAVTTTAGSANTVDFKQKAPSTGLGAVPMYAVMVVDESFTGLTSLTLEVQDSDQETGTFAAAAAGAAIPLAELKAGRLFVLPLPVGHKRYVRGAFRTVGTATAGRVSLYLTSSIQQNTPQPDAPRAWGGR